MRETVRMCIRIRQAPQSGWRAAGAAAALALVLAGSAPAAIINKSDDSHALNTTNAWAGGAVPGAGDVAMWTNIVTASRSPLLGNDLSIAGLSLYNPTGAQEIVASAGNTLTIGSSGIDMTAAAADLAVHSDVALGASQTWRVGAVSNRLLTVDGVVGGAFNLTKTGAGLLYLNPGSANTYGGVTTIGAGTLRTGHPGALGTGSVVLAGGTLHLAADSTPTTAHPTAIMAASTVIADRRTVGPAITHTLGNLSISNTTLSVAAGTNATSDTAGVRFGNTTLLLANATFNVASNAALTLGPLAGDRAFTKSGGTGTLTLSGASSRGSGTATLSAGTLVLTDPSALGSNSVALTLNGATLDLATDTSVNSHAVLVASTSTVLVNRATSGSGSAHTLGALSVTQAVTLAVQPGTNVTDGTAALGVGAVTLAAALTINTATSVVVTVPSVTLNGGTNRTLLITGGGSVSVTGTVTQSSSGNLFVQVNAPGGSLTLSGTNGYKGNTALIQGTLNVGSATALGAATGQFNLNGGTLDNTSGGALTLTANNPQSWGGDFTFAGSADLGLGAGAVTLTTNRTVTVNAATLTVGGVVSGPGLGLTKAGPGTLVLMATNTYNGATTVNAGLLRVQGMTTLGSTVSVNSGGALGGMGYLRGAVTVYDGGTLAPGTSVGTLTVTNLTLNAGSTNVFEFNASPAHDRVVVGAGGSLTLNGGGFLLVEEGTTNAWTQDGVYPLLAFSGTPGGAGVSALSVLNPLPGKVYTFSYSGSAVVLAISTIKTWDGGSAVDSNWQTAENWDGDAAPVAPATLEFAGPERTGNNNDYPDHTPFGGLRFLAGADAFILMGAPVNLVGNVENASTNLQTIALPVVLDSGSRAIDAAAGDLELAGDVSDGGSGYSLTKTGAYTLTLGGSNSYGGAVAIAEGAVRVTDGAGLGTTAAGTAVSNGAALMLEGDIAVPAEALTLSGAGVAGDGALRNLSGTNRYAGPIVLASASRIESAAGELRLDVAAGNAVAGAAQALTVGGAGAVTVADPIAITTGTLTKEGAGTLTLAATNTFTGAVTILGGAVRVQAPAGLGTTAGGVSVANGAALELFQAGAVGAEPLALTGTGVLNAGALRHLGGTGSYAGAITLGGTSRISAEAGTLALSGGVTGADQNLIVGGAGNVTFNSAIATGSGGLMKDGAGVLLLNVVNTYSGQTDVQYGTLRYGVTNALAGGTVTVSGGTLDLALYPDTVGLVVMSAGAITGSSGVLTSTTGFVFGGGTASAVLGGAVGLTKSTAGAVALTRANTYSGATTIEGGTLTLGSTTALGPSASAKLLFSPASAGTVQLNGNNATVTALSAPDATAAVENGNLTNAATLIANLALTNTFAGVLRDGNAAALAFTKAGAGTLTLAGTNTYSGATSLAGTLALGAAEVLPDGAGKGNITLSGTLDLAGWSETINGLAGAGGVTNTGAAATLTLGAGDATANFSGTIREGAGTIALTKTGTGIETLSATNAHAFRGDITIAAGTLRLGAANQIPDGAAGGNLIVEGAFDLNGRSEVINGLFGAGVVTNAGAVPVTLTLGGNGASSLFTGSIQSGSVSGTVAVVKTGTGTVALGGPSTYNAATTIQTGGALNIRHGNALGATAAGTTVNTGGALELEGDIVTAAEALSVNGAGVAADGALRNVAGTNTFTGVITLAGASRLGSAAGRLRLDVPGATAISATTFGLTVGGAGDLEVADPITGTTATLTKDGAGTLTLEGTNTYSGATTVLDGLLRVQGRTAAGSAVTIASGGRLGGMGTILGSVTNDEGGTLAPGASVGTLTVASLTLAAGSTNAFEFSGTPANDQVVVTAAGGLRIAGGGVALYAEGTADGWTVDGTYRLIQYNGALGGAGLTALSVLNPQPGKKYAFSAASGWVVVTVSSASVWDGGSTTDALWQSGANWAGDATPLAGAELIFDGSARLENTNNFAANTPFAGLTFPAGGGAFVLSGNPLNLTAALTSSNTLEQTLDLDLVLNGDSREFHADAGPVTVNGAISEAGGAWGLRKTGSGTVILRGENTFSGAVAVVAGALNVQAPAGLGAIAAGTAVSNGAALELEGDVTTAAEPLALNGAGVAGNGSLRNVAGTNRYTGAITLGSASLIAADADTLTLDVAAGNTIAGAGMALTFGGAGTIAVEDPIATAGGTVTKEGAGATILSAANTFTGTVTVAAGALRVQHAQGLGTTVGGTLVSSGAALELAGSVTTLAEPLTLNGGGITDTFGALRSTTGSNTYAGTITLASASRIAADASSTLTLDVAAGNTIAGAGMEAIFDGDGTVVVNDAIATGTGTVTKEGDGTLVLNAGSSFTGAMAIQNGVVNVRHATGLGTAAGGVEVSSGAALQLQGSVAVGNELLTLSGDGRNHDGALRSVGGGNSHAGPIVLAAPSFINCDTGVVTLTGGVTGSGHTLTAGGTGNVTFATQPIATFDGGVTKVGPGFLSMNTTHAYTGLTDVQAGTLRYNVANALASGDVRVSGGTFDLQTYADTVGTVTLASGTISGAIGATTGILTSTTGFILESGTASVVLAGTVPLTKRTAGAVSLTRANLYAGTTTIEGGTLTLGTTTSLGPAASARLGYGPDSDGLLRLNGNYVTLAALNAPDGRAAIENGHLSSNVILTVATTLTNNFAGVLRDGGTGTVALTKTVASGVLTLSGTNTYSGTTRIAAGTLQLGSAEALPNGPGKGNVTLSGVLDLSGWSDTINGLNGAGAVTNTAAATMATLTVGDGDATQSFTGTIRDGGGGVALTKVGAGIQTLAAATNAHAYSGQTHVDGGTLRLGAPHQIPNGAGRGDMVLAGGIFDLNGQLEVLNGLWGAGGYVTNGATATTLHVGDNDATSGFAGGIHDGSGAGRVALVKVGAGTQTLAAASTYGGLTTVATNGGTLNIEHGNALGSTAAGTIVYAGGTLQLAGDPSFVTAAEALTINGEGATTNGALRNAGGYNTFAGVVTLGSACRIQSAAGLLTLDTTGPNALNVGTQSVVVGGAGDVTVADAVAGTTATLAKDGSGTLTFLGTNTYTGTTVVNDGLLRVHGLTATGASVVVRNGGTLGGLGAIQGPLTILAGGTLAPGTSVGTLTVTNLTLEDGSIHDFEFNATPANDKVVVTAGGALTIHGGGFHFYTEGTTNGWATDGVYELIRFTGAIGGLGVPALSVLNPQHGKVYAFGFTGSNVTVTISGAAVWDGGSAVDNQWLTGENWEGDAAPASPAALQFAGSQRTSTFNNFPGHTTFGGLLFAPDADAFSLSGAPVNLIGNIINDSMQTQSIELPLVLDGSGREVITAAGDVVLAGSIGDDDSGYGLTKRGAHVLTLSASNTFNGAVIVSDGILKVRNGLALGGTAGGTTVSNGAALELEGDIATAAEPLVLNGAGVAGSGVLRNVSGANLFAGAVTLGGACRIQSDTNLLTLGSGTPITGAFPLTVGGAGDVAIASAINTGTGTLSKEGSGALIVSGPSSYSGATTIRGGVMNVRHPNGLGSPSGGVFVTNNAALQLQGAGAIGAEAVALEGTGVAEDGALRHIGGVSSLAGAITLMSDSRIHADAGTLTLSGGITGEDRSLIVGGSGTIVITSAGIATTNGTLTKEGSGMVSLNAPSSYTGLTEVRGGVLRYGVANALASGDVRISGGTLDVMTFTDGVGAVTLASGTIAGTAGVLSSTNAFVLESGTVSGILGGSGGVIKNTGGAVTLSGANTYAGVTMINAGTLVVGHASAVGPAASSRVVFGDASNGRLQLNGSTVLTGAISSPDALATIENASGAASAILVVSNAVDVAFAGVLQNGGAASLALVKAGAGTQTLSGNNLFTGGTTLNGGTLRLKAPAALGGDGALLSIGNGSVDLATDSSVNRYSTTLIGPATFLSNRDSSGAGILHTLGSLAVGSATLSVTAGTNVTSGTADLAFGSTALLAATPVFQIASNASLTLGVLSGNVPFTKSGGTGTLRLTGTSGRNAGVVTVSAGTLKLERFDALGTAAVPLALSGGATLHIAAEESIIAYPTTVAAGGATIVSDVAAPGPGITHALGALTISGQLNVLCGGNVTDAHAGLAFGATTLSAPAVFNVDTGIELTLGALGSNAVSITKLGAGTLALDAPAGPRTATAAATLANGVLRLGVLNALNTVPSPLNFTGGTLQLRTSAGGTFGGANLVVTGGQAVAIMLDRTAPGGSLTDTLGTMSISSNRLDIFAGGNITNGTATLALGAVTATADTVINTTAPAALALNGSLTGSTLADVVAAFTGTSPVTIAGAIANGAGHTLGVTFSTGGSTVTLLGASSYTGKTRLQNCRLKFAAENRLGGNPSAWAEDHLRLDGVTLEPTASVSIQDTNRGITVDGGGVTFEIASTQRMTVACSMTGTGNLTKTGGGALILSATNTYRRDTWIRDGRLEITATGALLGSSNVVVETGTNVALRILNAHALRDDATLSVAADSGKVYLTNGVSDVVGILYLGGTQMVAGTWGSTESSAEHTDNRYFAGAGVLWVRGPDVDLDADGLGDMWERIHFGGTNQPGGEAGGNWDGDAFDNTQEYVAGTDPTDDRSYFTVGIEGIETSVYVRVDTVLGGALLVDHAGRYYALDTRPQLAGAPWEGVPGYTNVLGDSQILYVQPPTATNGGFYRARVWLQEP